MREQQQVTPRPRALIVDQDSRVARLVARILEREGYKVEAASDGRQALAAALRLRPDLMILEIVMPGLDGIELCQRVRAQQPLDTTLVLFLTTHDDLEDVAQAFHAGADDYLCKPFSQQELLLRVRALLRRREARAPDSVLQVGGVCLDARQAAVTVNGSPLSLPPLQFKLLHYLTCKAGEVVPAEMLLQEVWGYPVGTGDPALVRAHIHQLRRRLDAHASAPALVLTVGRRGYVVEPNAPLER